MGFVEKLIETAKKEIGVTEVPRGSNKGPKVSEYQRRTGYNEPVAWCMCFLYWCTDETCKSLGIANNVIRSGGCDEVKAWAKNHDCLYTSPKPGDFGLVMKTSSDATHIFLVAAVNGTTLSTIEGNTNDDGNRDGYEVCKRTRTHGPKYLYVRPFNVMAAIDDKPLQMNLIGPDGAAITKMDVVRGTSRAPVRLVATKVGFKSGGAISNDDIKWDADSQSIDIQGKPLAAQPLVIDGVSYVPIRVLASFLGWGIEVDGAKATVKLV